VIRTKKSIVYAWLCLTALYGVAGANIDDGKPWEWDSLSHSDLRNEQRNGRCDGLADFLKAPDFQCEFDKKPWDDHLKKESKIERSRDRNQQQPGNCFGGAFMAFLPRNQNGTFPDYGNDAEPVKQEFLKNVSALVCTFDDTEKDPSVTYIAAKHTLVLHLTRKELWNAGWVMHEMRKGDLKTLFPLLDKYFRNHS
jgi:hypothetical protein